MGYENNYCEESSLGDCKHGCHALSFLEFLRRIGSGLSLSNVADDINTTYNTINNTKYLNRLEEKPRNT